MTTAVTVYAKISICLSGAGYTPEPAYGGPPSNLPQFPGSQYVNDPMANAAMQYGQTLAGQGKDYLHKNVSLLSCGKTGK
jgi:hypothetical protein